MKPLGHKSYGSIPHLIGSRVGPSDHHAENGQCLIATQKKRDIHDTVIVQEKLDGGNVGIARIGNDIVPITRAGYLAVTSQYATHHAFALWVHDNESRFLDVLMDGERLCGEWLLTAVGTRYKLHHEPFVCFDIMKNTNRVNFAALNKRVRDVFVTPTILSIGEPMPIETVLPMLDVSGHGAIDKVEGAVWRVERKGVVDFLVKYVRPEKVDGLYLKGLLFNDVLPEHNYLIDHCKSLTL